MNRKKRLIILALTAFILFFCLFELSVHIYRDVRELPPLRQENREVGDRLHSWMTPEEIAKRYDITVDQVFKALRIDPSAGDEDLPLRQLREKYNLTREKVNKALESLHINSPKKEFKQHE